MQYDRRIWPWIPSALVLLMAGCRASGSAGGAGEPEPPVDEVGEEPSADPTAAGLTAGTSLEGRPIEYSVHGEGELTVLLLATIHGDEPAGTPLLGRLAEELAGQPPWLAGRRVVLVPVANPDGLARGTRRNARGVDLNRNFPAGNFRGSRRHGDEPLSEPESRALAELIELYAPARILSLHQPADLLDYDGPAAALAAALEGTSPLPVRRLGSRPGSLGSYAGVDLGLPVLTVELPGGAERLAAEELWERYGGLILAAIAYPGDAAAEAK